MQEETDRILAATRGLNNALIAGLRTALFLLEEGDGISPEKKHHYISSLRLMVFLGEEGSRSGLG